MISRINSKAQTGLTQEQVKKRIEENLVNYDTSVKTKSEKQIIFENIFTLFNLLNALLGVAIICVGSFKNLMFLGVIVCNIIIGTIQEIRSKRIVDKLSVISATKVKAIRDSQKQEIAIDEIVLDEVVELSSGNQVVTDVIILEGECEVNEAFITGESENVYKKEGDMILSGSFIVVGKVRARVEHIGLDNYTAKISHDAKYVKHARSQIMDSLNSVIKVISILIVPIGILLFGNQMSIDGNTFQMAVVNTVAAIIGMIPEGLILLTSVVLAVSVMRLSKYNVLVQELYCIETLARVDVICLDKTGTITEGSMLVNKVISLNENNTDQIEEILSAISKNTDDENATIAALKEKYQKNNNWKVIQKIPFSSQKKWSGISFQKEGSYIIGAPEFILKENINQIKNEVDTYIDSYRVLLLAHSKHPFPNKELPEELEPIALILISDKIREEATKTLNYFKEEKVDIKIISGDNVKTVSQIAKKVGVENADLAVDATTLKTKDQIKEAIKKYVVFGRVTPEQKKELVKALQSEGHIVAMTGDGINDVLALKEADCSIAMSSGSDAARNVSELVLLDSNFDSMPKVVAEGRRTINNIERSASLFLVKTIYASFLAVFFLFVASPYPFMPIQISIVSVVTIGIPSFILALEPNKERIKGVFLRNVLSKSFPNALTTIISITLLIGLSHIIELSPAEISTLAVYLTAYVGFMLLYRLCQPFNWIRRILFISMITLFILAVIILKDLFSLVSMNAYLIILLIDFMIVDFYLYKAFLFLFQKWLDFYHKKIIKTK